ncbi:MAG: hypothetical protein JXQ27_01710 [Acidobacteria bacterium]|nr:hypothetical protein [Acidobacteriota bacterium]
MLSTGPLGRDRLKWQVAGMVLLACWVVTGACSVGKKALVEPYRAMAESKLRALDRIMDDVRNRPPLRAEKIDGPAMEVVFRDVLNDESAGNAGMIFFDRYEQHPPHVRSLYDDVEYVDRWWLWPKLALRGDGELPATIGARTLRRTFEGLADLRFVLVIRAEVWAPPMPIEEEAPGGLFRFTKGKFIGEALLYDFEKKQFQGGVFVSATSRDQVTNLSGASMQDALQRDLLHQVQQAALLNLARHLPTLRIPRLHR